MDITREHLNFLEEAALHFEGNDRNETYRDKDDRFIALRYGADRDCIQIYELKGEVAFFANIMRRAPQLIIPKEREEVRWFAAHMEAQLQINEHKGGWLDEDGSFLYGELERNLSSSHSPDNHERIIRLVNVANFAMMLADKARQR